MVGTSPVASEEGRLSTRDGLRLAYSLYRAPGHRAGVVVCHGVADHRQRYGHLVAALLPEGISVLTFDLRGHGESGGARGFVRHFDAYFDDLEVVLAFGHQRLGGPIALFAHCLGGLIAVRCLQERSLDVEGVVLSNPALGLRLSLPAWKMTAARFIGRFAPGFMLPLGVAPGLISRDAEEVRRHASDPLVFDRVAVRWATELAAAQRRALAAPADFAPSRLLVLLGLADGVVDPAVSRDFFERCASADRQVQTFEPCRHELINELPKARAEVLAEVAAFLLRQTDIPPGG